MLSGQVERQHGEAYLFQATLPGDSTVTKLWAKSFEDLRRQLLLGYDDVVIEHDDTLLSESAWAHVVPPATEPIQLDVRYIDAGFSAEEVDWRVKQKLEDARAGGQTGAAADGDKALLAAMLAPLDAKSLPVSVADIFALSSQTVVPLLPTVINQLCADWPEGAEFMCPSFSRLALVCSAVIHIGLNLEGGGTEITDTSVYTLMLIKLLGQLKTRDRSGRAPELHSLANSMQRFSTKGSHLLKEGSRPDSMVIADGLMMAYGEDKGYGSMDDALQDLKAYMKGGLQDVFYANVPYILSYAAAGASLRLGRVLKDGTIDLPRNLDVRNPQDALLAVQVVLTWYRIMVCLVQMAVKRTERPAMMMALVREHETTILIKPQNVTKEVAKYEAFVDGCCAKLEVEEDSAPPHMQQAALSSIAYRAGRLCPFLARSKADPSVTSTASSVNSTGVSSSTTEAATYFVQVEPVGRFIPLDDVKLEELPLLFYAILFALAVLHAAGLVHRDVRWANVLWLLNHAFLLDLEAPRDVHIDWDADTLHDKKYTKRSDLLQAAKMLGAYSELTPEAQAVLLRMRSDDATAASLLSDPWFAAARITYPFQQALDAAAAGSPLTGSSPLTVSQLDTSTFVTLADASVKAPFSAPKRGKPGRPPGKKVAAGAVGSPAAGLGTSSTAADAPTDAAASTDAAAGAGAQDGGKAGHSGKQSAAAAPRDPGRPACRGAAVASVGCGQGHLLPPLRRHLLMLPKCAGPLRIHGILLDHRGASRACALGHLRVLKLC